MSSDGSQDDAATPGPRGGAGSQPRPPSGVRTRVGERGPAGTCGSASGGPLRPPPERHPGGLRRFAREESGQATVEYALLLAASLAMVLALGALFRAASDGVLGDKAVQAASHSRQAPMADALKDVLLY